MHSLRPSEVGDPDTRHEPHLAAILTLNLITINWIWTRI